MSTQYETQLRGRFEKWKQLKDFLTESGEIDLPEVKIDMNEPIIVEGRYKGDRAITCYYNTKHIIDQAEAEEKAEKEKLELLAKDKPDSTEKPTSENPL